MAMGAKSPSKPKSPSKVKCSSCDEKKKKTDFCKEELANGDERRCKECRQSTDALFSMAMFSSRAKDDVSPDAEVSPLSSVWSTTRYPCTRPPTHPPNAPIHPICSRAHPPIPDDQVERLSSADTTVQNDAASRLWTLSRNGSEETDKAIAAAGAIGPLVGLLKCKDERAWFAAGTLQSLSCRSQSRKKAIVEAGGVELLIALLQSGDADDKELCAMALSNLSDGTHDDKLSATIERQVHIVGAGAVRPLIDLLRDGDDGGKEAAAAALANLFLLAGIHPHTQAPYDSRLRNRAPSEAFEMGVVSRLASLLRDGSPEAKHEAARALKELTASEDTDRVAAVVRELGLKGSGASGEAAMCAG